MHGMNGHHLLDAPSIGGVNDDWKPSLAAAEGRAPAPEEWRIKMRNMVACRPDALASARFVLDLQRLEKRPCDITPADVARRNHALAAAAALAERLPVWPNPPLPEPRPMLDCARARGGGWHDGVRIAKRDRKQSMKKFRERAAREDDDSDDEGDSGHRQPSAPQLLPRADFPLTLAAAKAREGSAWALGDALIAECGEPGASHIKSGAYSRIEEAQKFLATRGTRLSFTYLAKLRNIAYAFPPPLRQFSYTVHQEASNPETLDAVVAALPEGRKLTASYVRQAVRSRNGNAPRAPIPASVSGLCERLADALEKTSKAARIQVVAGLMSALRLSPEDFAPACAVAARQLALTPSPPVERAAAAA